MDILAQIIKVCQCYKHLKVKSPATESVWPAKLELLRNWQTCLVCCTAMAKFACRIYRALFVMNLSFIYTFTPIKDLLSDCWNASDWRPQLIYMLSSILGLFLFQYSDHRKPFIGRSSFHTELQPTIFQRFWMLENKSHWIHELNILYLSVNRGKITSLNPISFFLMSSLTASLESFQWTGPWAFLKINVYF